MKQSEVALMAALLLFVGGRCKAVGSGVLELKISFGPGYRIYLAQDGRRVILLLAGGDKSTQAKDIPMAQSYWSEYRERRNA